MIHADFTDKLSEGQITIVNNIIKNIINDNVGRFRKRNELTWLGNATYQTPEVFHPTSLIVWLEGQEIAPQGLNGIDVLGPNTFKFKLAHTVSENSMVTCYYNILL